jgi:hypothetical protein
MSCRRTAVSIRQLVTIRRVVGEGTPRVSFYTRVDFIGSWLTVVERVSSPYRSQRVFDVTEASPPEDVTLSGIAECMLTARFDLEFLAEASRDYGWDNVGALVEATKARGATADVRRRGEFGEVLMGVLLETSHSWDIPVNKLRFEIREGQTLPGTDVLALVAADDGEISGVCYAEAKLRTTPDKAAPLLGYRQLVRDYDARLPEILPFVAQRMREMGHPLYEPFRRYMAAREDNRDLDHFHLCLVYEAAAWDEAALQNLEDEGVDIAPFESQVVRIRDLRPLTDRCFQELGMTMIIDDD